MCTCISVTVFTCHVTQCVVVAVSCMYDVLCSGRDLKFDSLKITFHLFLHPCVCFIICCENRDQRKIVTIGLENLNSKQFSLIC